MAPVAGGDPTGQNTPNTSTTMVSSIGLLGKMKDIQTRSEGLDVGACACNPSYSGGRDQEDRALRPTQAKN
jgi:hypothetical protein